MNAAQVLKRNEKAQHLPVIQIGDESFYVESEQSKIAYKVSMGDKPVCCCPDFAKQSRNDPEFKCKHIMAVLSSTPAEVCQASVLEKRKAKLDERFIINLRDKDFVLYAGLLDLAHQRGLQRLEVELVQFPTKDNGMEAVCKATAISKLDEHFVDIGDANPLNTSKNIAQHIIRMASTRAKARVLRDLSNIGITALEELGIDPPEESSSKEKTKSQATEGPKGVTRIGPRKITSQDVAKTQPAEAQTPVQPIARIGGDPKAAVTNPPVPENQVQPKPVSQVQATARISEAQMRAIANLSRRRGISEVELDALSVETYGLHLDSLTPTDASAFIRQLQQSA